MSVKKIFMTLIVIVACLMIGAFLLNVLLPNATVQLVNMTENMIYSATGMVFDFNGDGISGTNSNDVSGQAQYQADTNEGAGGDNVSGFQ